MTKNEMRKLSSELDNELLRTMYVSDLLELLQGTTEDTFTFKQMLEAILKSYELATLRADELNRKTIGYVKVDKSILDL